MVGIHLYEESRQSPVSLAGPLEQVVRIRFKVAEEESAHLPRPVSLVNDAGDVHGNGRRKGRLDNGRTEVDPDGGNLSGGNVAPLRALLLEESDRGMGRSCWIDRAVVWKLVSVIDPFPMPREP